MVKSHETCTELVVKKDRLILILRFAPPTHAEPGSAGCGDQIQWQAGARARLSSDSISSLL
jgi:hypothetical protein